MIKIDCITRYEIRQYIEKGDKFLLIRGGFETKIDALRAVKTMLDNGVYAKDTLGVTESQYANEEKIKQDFPICQWWCWSDWFNGYDMLVKMIEYEGNNCCQSCEGYLFEFSESEDDIPSAEKRLLESYGIKENDK